MFNPTIAVWLLLGSFVLFILIKMPVTFALAVSSCITLVYCHFPLMAFIQQMGKSIDKIINRIEANPYRSDISFDEIKRYLEHFGFKELPNRGKGSHHVFYKDGCEPLVIPVHGKTIKAAYVHISVKAVKTSEEREGI